MLPTFADPKTDFVFKRIFGTEAHKHLLIELLNALLELDRDRRIVDLVYLTAEQSVPLAEMKLSVVDVKCRDERGRTYVVEMQVLNVDAFEKRIVYNTSKAYVMQLPTGEAYRDLCPVVGVTICDFVFWPDPAEQVVAAGAPAAGAPVPMLSRWRMQERHSGALGLSDVQYVFMELPKYAGGAEPEGTVDRWAYFFREAENLKVVPPMFQESPYMDALEVARTAHFTAQEWDAYDLAKMAEQDARGALILARKEGRQEGREEGLKTGREAGLRENIEDLCRVLGIKWTPGRQARAEAMTLPELQAFWKHLVTRKIWPDESTAEP